MKKGIWSVVIVVVVLSLFNAVVLATPAVLEPCAFESKSDQTGDWYWLRNTGDYVKWVFNPLEMSGGIVPRSVYLIVQAKVTNGIDGGSGYETSLKMRVTGNNITDTVNVRLRNPFRPLDPEISGGLGYMTHGWGGPIRDRIWQGADSITVEVEYSPQWKNPAHKRDIQVAFEKNNETMGILLGYMR